MTTIAAAQATSRSEPDRLEVLRTHRVRHAVLRPSLGPDDDIDVLVAPEDLAGVLALLRSDGYVEVPAQGRGTHHFLVRLEGRTFAHLDVVTSLDFGPLSVWRSGMADACLDRAVAGPAPGDVPYLDPQDELWVTLLHLATDDGKEPRGSQRLDRVVALARVAMSEPLADWHRALSVALPRSTTPEDVLRLCAEGDVEQLGETLSRWRPGMRRRCLRTALASSGAARVAGTAIVRATERLHQWPGRRGLLVTVLGPDGAGKSTLIDAVGDAWLWRHQRVYFGLWPDAHDAGALARALWPLRRPLRAVRRYGVGVLASARGRLVLFDRYVYDAAVPPQGRFLVLKRWYFRVLLHSVPAPDLAVLLEAPGAVLHARKGEMTPQVLDDNRDAIAAHVRGVHRRSGRPQVLTVDATQCAADVADQVVAAIWQLAAERLGRRTDGGRP
jgi:thymidylate kinase